MGTVHDLMDRASSGDKPIEDEAIMILGLFRCRECNYDMKKPIKKCPKCGHPTLYDK